MRPPPKYPQSFYASIDVYATEDGMYMVDYAQYETSAAVRVYPVQAHTDMDGKTHIVHVGHGEPLMSVMTRSDVSDRMPQMLATVLRVL